MAVSDVNYPRLQVLEDLFHTIHSQSSLSKDASSTLIELGEAISRYVTSNYWNGRKEALRNKARRDVCIRNFI